MGHKNWFNPLPFIEVPMPSSDSERSCSCVQKPEGAIQRQWQHWTQKTPDEGKKKDKTQNTHTTQKVKIQHGLI